MSPEAKYKRMSREDEIKADIAEAEAEQKEALEAGDHALALEIQKTVLVLLEDLENERQHQRQLELAAAAGMSSCIY
jgi:hypothetical protein